MTKQVKKYITLAKNFVGLVEGSGIPIKEAYIFGSRANGEEHIGSDLDTCIVSPKFGRDRIEERVKLMLLGNDVSDLIEPHPFSPRDFADENNLLATEIKKTGIRIA